MAHVSSLIVLVAAIALETLPGPRIGGSFRLTTRVPRTVPIVPQRPGGTWLYHQARVVFREALDAPFVASLGASIDGAGWVAWRVEGADGRTVEARWSRSTQGEQLALLERRGERVEEVLLERDAFAAGELFSLACPTPVRCVVALGEQRAEAGGLLLAPPLHLTLATGSGAVKVRDLTVRDGTEGRHFLGRARAGGWGLSVAVLAAWLGVVALLLRMRERTAALRGAWIATLGAVATCSPVFPVLLPVVLGLVAALLVSGTVLLRWMRGALVLAAVLGFTLLALSPREAVAGALEAGAPETRRVWLGAPVTFSVEAGESWRLDLELGADTVAEVTPLGERGAAFPAAGWPAVVLSARQDLDSCVAWNSAHAARCVGERFAGGAVARSVTLAPSSAGSLALRIDDGPGASFSFAGPAIALQVKVLSGAPLRVGQPTVAAWLPDSALDAGRWAYSPALALGVGTAMLGLAWFSRRRRSARIAVVAVTLALLALPSLRSSARQPLIEDLASREQHALGWYSSWMRSGTGKLVEDGVFRSGPTLDPALDCFRVLALGSSSTWGTGVEAEQTYIHRLGGRLAAHARERGPGTCVSTINAGKQGSWSSALRELYPALYRQLGAQVVTVSMGNNDRIAPLAFDVPRRLFQVGASRAEWFVLPVLFDPTGHARILRNREAGRALRLRDNLVRLGRAVVADGATLVLIPEPTAAWHEAREDPHAKFSDAVREAGRMLGATVVDVGLAFEQRPYDDLFLDDVHLTPHGHELMAAELVDAVRSASTGSRVFMPMVSSSSRSASASGFGVVSRRSP